MLQTFSQVVIVAEYYANKNYIAKNLCENRDKPMMHCDGKCCLRKKLAKDSNSQAPSPRNQKNEQTVTLFFSTAKFDIQYFPAADVANQYFSHNELRTFAYHPAVFHPPAA